MNISNFLKNTFLLGFSVLVAIALAEGVCRVVFDPVDFLLPKLVNDEWLGHRIPPNSGGHDALGFRNLDVPEVAKIVAFGDSQTYGISATQKNSWPAQLAGKTKLTVYNMGLGGYGPLQYSRLLQTQVLPLKSEIILVGLYFGNDFIDSYRLVYNRDNWQDYRNSQFDFGKIEETIIDDGQPEKIFSGVRDWLARSSVFYRIVTGMLRPLMNQSRLQNLLELDRDRYKPTDNDTILFDAVQMEHAVDLQRKELAEGFRLGLRGISEIKDFCDQNNLKLLVVLIPTKELVYSDLVLDSDQLREKEAFTNIARSEGDMRAKVFASLAEKNIEVVDLLPVLRSAAVDSPIYPVFDSHPNAMGYEVIATTIANKLGY
jgi:lysophospholipase L1-like esterase